MKVNGVLTGDYEIIEQIGEGGFGIVYKARQQTTGQLVAIKMVRPMANRDEAIADRLMSRFLRETKLCAKLYHPHIVQVIDAGQADDGQLYTVFSFAPGKSLQQVLAEEGPPSPREVKHLMMQVLDALACAHAEGIIHRDLKPSNIMVVPTGARRNAVVLDFGIGTVARAVDGQEYTRLTGTAELIGTPGYAAPEQLKGQATSSSTDLFSWGLVVLECFTGEPVYCGHSLPDIIFRQLSPDPVPIPEALQHHPLGMLLAEVLRKDVDERPSSAAEILTRLDACDLSRLNAEHRAFRYANASLLGHSAPVSATRHASGQRQVTALCCELAVEGPRAPLEQERHDDLLRELFATCAAIAEQHGGSLVAAMGRQMLSFFGFVRADEHDALHAARAALAIEHAVLTEHERISPRQIELRVRLGLHTGLIAVSDASTDAEIAVGSTPALAAKIAALASPNTTMVSATTRRSLRAHYSFEAAGVLEGEAGGTDVYCLSAGSKAPGEGEHRDDLTELLPLVGRERELGLLEDLWKRACAGAGQCSLITGEPGIGKSRLVAEICAWVREEPHTRLELRCVSEAQNSPLLPVREMIERLLAQEPSDDPLSRVEGLLSRHGFDLGLVIPLYASMLDLELSSDYAPLDISPALRKQRTYEALRTLVAKLACERPVLMLVEDMHWADPSTTEFIQVLSTEIADSAVSVLITARPEFSPGVLAAGILHVSLNRLPSYETEALVAELADGREVPQDVLGEIVRRTDGVPLFVEEFTRMLFESGVLVPEGDAYVIGRPLSLVEVPSSLRDLLSSRLDRLGVAKSTAQVAAAIGREFGVPLLFAAGAAESSELAAHLEQLREAGLIQQKRSRKERRYLFKHALVRDAAYESLAKRDREQVHLDIARALESKFSDVAESRPELLAHHYAGAERKREAIDYAKKAAASGLRRSAYMETQSQVEQALGWSDAFEPGGERKTVELELNSLLMPAMMAAEGYGNARLESVMSNILELSESIGSSPHEFPTLYALTTYHHLRSNRHEAMRFAEKMVALYEKSGVTIQGLAAYAMLSQCFIMAGRYEEAREIAERSVALHDPQEHRDMVLSFGVDIGVFGRCMVAQSLTYLGYLDRAVEEYDRAIALAREMKLPDMLSLALFLSAYAHRSRRDHERIIEVTDEVIVTSERYGLAFTRTWGLMMRCVATHDVEELDALLAAQKKRGELAGTPFLVSILAESEMARGRPAAAMIHVDEALRFADEHQERWYLPAVLCLKGMCLEALGGSNDAAEAVYLQAIDIAREQQAKTEQLDATVELAKLWAGQGRTEEARGMLSEIYGWFTEGLGTQSLIRARDVLDNL